MLNWAGMLPFILITTFTPGPNNVSSASMGMMHGYRKSLPYILGIMCGFYFIMLACGLLSQTITQMLPSFEVVLRIIGTLYILWLAYETLRSSYDIKFTDQSPLTFWNGFFLQVINVKAIFYGLTLYGSFFQPLLGRLDWLILSALFCAGLAFCSVTLWALFGVVIQRYLKKPILKKSVNIILALMLFYIAVDISGLFPLI